MRSLYRLDDLAAALTRSVRRTVLWLAEESARRLTVLTHHRRA